VVSILDNSKTPSFASLQMATLASPNQSDKIERNTSIEILLASPPVASLLAGRHVSLSRCSGLLLLLLVLRLFLRRLRVLLCLLLSMLRVLRRNLSLLRGSVDLDRHFVDARGDEVLAVGAVPMRLLEPMQHAR
jgi:hypothetical protein